MKTFREYTDVVNPAYAVGGASVGPGMGQYLPTADLNLRAQKQKEVKKSDIDQLERYADRLFGSVGIDVEFTRHFLDRVNDARNKVQITPSELTRLFKQSYKKFGKRIAKLGPDAQAVITDMKTDINMPFVLNLKGGELELVAKTVMRKKDFKTPNTKLAFEGIGEPNIFSQKNPRIPRKKGQPAKSKKHSDLYTDEDPRGTIHGLGFKDVETAKSSVKKIESSDRSHAHKIQAAIAMEQRARVMGKTAEANVYRAYIDKMKKKTKDKNESLWANIHKKRQRIKRGSGEKMRKKGEKGAPTPAQMQRAKGEGFREDKEDEELMKTMRIANTKLALAKRVKQLRQQQKSNLDRIKDKERKKTLKKTQDQQLKGLKTAAQGQIKQLQKMGDEIEEKAPDTSDAMKRYKAGKAGFTDIAHLKAKGLIKRSDGTKKKSDKYK